MLTLECLMKVKIKKGLKLNIAGSIPSRGYQMSDVRSSIYAIYPDDYPGFIAKVDVKEGDRVGCGTPLMHHKNNEDLRLVSPVAGRVKSIVRGERRHVIRVEIEADYYNYETVEFAKPVDESSARQVLAQSGLMALMRQRPFDIVPDCSSNVRDIFITAIDDAPLAPGYSRFDALFNDNCYQAGIDLLRLITRGKVYLSHDADFTHTTLKGVELVEVQGPYPAGNVGVQIANIKPIDKGDVVWTLDMPTLGRIGHLALEGTVDMRTLVAVVGPEVEAPALVPTLFGVQLNSILHGLLMQPKHHQRIISGNVLVGVAESSDGFLHYPYRQVTVIAEGDDMDEFMGWASLSPGKISESRSFPGHFLSRAFRPDARINGGERAMIMSGQYDRYIPMDILPEYLIKAILSNNIDDMEKLGIYEVAPEDFAAAEYADTSKLPLQAIVRRGLDYLRKELE